LIAGAELRAFSTIESNGAILIEDEKDQRLLRETPRRSASGSHADSHDGFFFDQPREAVVMGSF
jgi:hypothetical protein